VWHFRTPSRPSIIICNVSSIVGCISIYLEIVTHYLRNLPRQVVYPTCIIIHMSTLTSDLPYSCRLCLILWAVLWNQLFYTRRVQIAGLSVTASFHGSEFSPLQSRPGVECCTYSFYVPSNPDCLPICLPLIFTAQHSALCNPAVT
jgi:hypothetical protein